MMPNLTFIPRFKMTHPKIIIKFIFTAINKLNPRSWTNTQWTLNIIKLFNSFLIIFSTLQLQSLFPFCIPFANFLLMLLIISQTFLNFMFEIFFFNLQNWAYFLILLFLFCFYSCYFFLFYFFSFFYFFYFVDCYLI